MGFKVTPVVVHPLRIHQRTFDGVLGLADLPVRPNHVIPFPSRMPVVPTLPVELQDVHCVTEGPRSVPTAFQLREALPVRGRIEDEPLRRAVVVRGLVEAPHEQILDPHNLAGAELIESLLPALQRSERGGRCRRGIPGRPRAFGARETLGTLCQLPPPSP